MLRSTPQLIKRSPSTPKHNPDILPLWACCKFNNFLRVEMLCSMMPVNRRLRTLVCVCVSEEKNAPPSQLALATVVNEPGCLTTTSTASMCPSKLSMKGLANILSIFAAFRARVRSLARAKGCIKGSRLRNVGVGSPGLVGRRISGAC